MAQNPVGLQEPSMDELLASIREIIEESSAAAEAAELTSGDQSQPDSAHNILPDATVEKPGSGRDEDSLTQATMPIHDAMRALAARIGLKKQEAVSGFGREQGMKQEAVSDGTSRTGNINNSAVSDGTSRTGTVNNSAVSDGTSRTGTVNNSAVSGKNEREMKKTLSPTTSPTTSFVSSPNITIAPTSAAIDPFSFGRMNVAPPANMTMPAPQPPQPLPPMSLSASIATPPPSPAKVKKDPPRAIKISPLPSVKNQEKPVFDSGHIPLNPQFRTLPLAQQSKAPIQDVSMASPPVRPTITVTTSSTAAAQSKEPRQALTDLEKGFLAEFEQSAELLLRPYIAGWLEEHFHHLFEKILREEIQRLMQKNMRR